MPVDRSTADTSPFVPGLGSGGKPSMRSGFGKQATSNKVNAPNFSLGRCTRDQASKVFLSTAHVNVEQKCLAGPGAVYNLPSAMDKQVIASKQTAPQYTFSRTEKLKLVESEFPGPGTYTRPGALGAQPDSQKLTLPACTFSSVTRDQKSKVFLSTAHIEEQRGTLGAAPGSYKLPDCLGRQPSSQKQSGPAFSMSKVDRLRSNYEKLAQSLPSVGQYETWHAIGKQPLSTSITLPAYAFGSSTWNKEEKRFLTLGHANKTLLGTASPANYDHQNNATLSSMGQQPLSNRYNSPTHRFSSAPRMVFKTSDTPGPGSYD